jgi:hypothetical protein
MIVLPMPLIIPPDCVVCGGGWVLGWEGIGLLAVNELLELGDREPPLDPPLGI